MMDAAILAMPDALGSPLWRPHSLQDIYDIPERTLIYYFAYRAGQAQAMRKSKPAEKSGSIGGVKLAG